MLGGTQSLHTNSYDEALALPSEHAATIALRTQQIIGHETGVADVVDPAGGSYYLESLTDELERLAADYIDRIDGMGGAVAAIEKGFYQDEIHEAAYRIQRGIEDGSRVIVGVNRFVDARRRRRSSCSGSTRPTQPSRSSGSTTCAHRAIVRPSPRRLSEVEAAARDTDVNLLPPMRVALKARATLGEVSDVLADGLRRVPPTLLV